MGNLNPEIHAPPVIDFKDVKGTGRARIAREVAAASETWGFFQIVNHGIDDKLLSDIRVAARSFFHSPREEKSGYEYRSYPPETEIHQGYLPVGGDPRYASFESFYYIMNPASARKVDIWPRTPSYLSGITLEYVENVRVLAKETYSLMSEALGLPPQTLHDRITLGGEPYAALRANFYPAGGPDTHFAIHSDPGGLTFLLQDDVPGLQVEKDGEFIDIEPMLNTITVNIADQTQILTNGRFKSVNHRTKGNLDRERLTIPIFYNPALDRPISPLEELVDDFHPLLYRSTNTFREYLTNVFKKGPLRGYVNQLKIPAL